MSSRDRELLIVGSGGHGKVVADTAIASRKWDKIIFLDDAWPEKKYCGSWPIAGKVEDFSKQNFHTISAIIAIGNNDVRYRIQKKMKNAGVDIVTVIHPSAQISQSAKVGAGTVVFANAVINADAVVGESSIINTAATVDHDCYIGNASHLSPGVHLAGSVKIGDFSWLGIGSVVKEKIEIGSNVIVGAGSVVVKDISDGVEVFGVPAKINIKKDNRC